MKEINPENQKKKKEEKEKAAMKWRLRQGPKHKERKGGEGGVVSDRTRRKEATTSSYGRCVASSKGCLLRLNEARELEALPHEAMEDLITFEMIGEEGNGAEVTTHPKGKEKERTKVAWTTPTRGRQTAAGEEKMKRKKVHRAPLHAHKQLKN